MEGIIQIVYSSKTIHINMERFSIISKSLTFKMFYLQNVFIQHVCF